MVIARKIRVNELLKKELGSIFKDLVVTESEAGRVTLIAKQEQVLAVLRFLKDRGFDHLALLSAVDWIQEKEFELVYILTRYVQDGDDLSGDGGLHIIVKTRIPRENPKFETTIGIFPNAEPYEREIHELFGIDFDGHPRLTPLFLERKYAVPPFRKDFDTREYVREVFDKIPFVGDTDK
jgi:NADH-quinone oxidoreductase subunit C